MARVADHMSLKYAAAVRHGGRLAFDARSGKELVDFSSSITPLGTPAAVIRALKQSVAQVSEYPDPRSGMLLAELSRYTGLSQSNIVVGNGAVEIIYNASLVFAGNHHRKTLVPAPTFQEYEAASRIHHGMGDKRMIHFESTSLACDLDAFIKRISADVGMIFVCNPNNPTGELLSQKQVLQIIDAAASAAPLCRVMIDECFVEMSTRPHESVISRVSRYDNLIVLRSLTKSFGLPGIRVGYAAASPGIIDMLYNAKMPWSVNCMAEAAGAAALRDAKGILDRTRSTIRKETSYLQERLSGARGISCYDTDANFILIKTARDAARLQARLAKERGILVRDCSNFRGLDRYHIRIAVKRRRENAMLADALTAECAAS